MYKLVYEKRYGLLSRNPWSEEKLAKSNIMYFSSKNEPQCLWIKAGPYAYCFINNFDEVESFLKDSSASDAHDYLDSHYDRREDIEEIVNKYL